MRSLLRLLLDNPKFALAAGLTCLVLSYLLRERFLLSQPLEVCGILIVALLAHHYWVSAQIEDQRRDERRKAASEIADQVRKVVMETHETRQTGLRRVRSTRDEPTKGNVQMFLARVDTYAPDSCVALFGIRQAYLPAHLGDRIEELLLKHPKLKFKICISSDQSPCVAIRAKEFPKRTAKEYKQSILKSRGDWLRLCLKFPGRIELRASDAIPYAELEAHGLDLDSTEPPASNSVILVTPLAYKHHGRECPSFELVEPGTRLFEFWAETVRNVWADASTVEGEPSSE